MSGVDLEAWLSHVIGNLAYWPANKVNELIPWKVSPKS
ncbi:transposase domain-containing protein [Acerihabitans arboris]|uniref:Transposase IS66 C-terminal domain-containing protein n=1 Tax=Acerihabitans arboris TaxID=2691583 RepID=A0A845SRX4_9GAMM|nr:hypothetical protein [Acerihabitans arboris]